MKILVEFSGMAKQHNDGHEKKELDLPEHSTNFDALKEFGISWSDIGFHSVNEVVKIKEEELKEGDHIKVFPNAFGG